MKSHLFLNDCFYMCREHVTELTGQDVDFVPPLFFLGGMSCTSVAGLVAKQACLVLCLSKSAFLSNH